MSPKFLNFEIILVYFLLLIPWPQTNVIKVFCSKDNSRLVRKIIRAKWIPILDKYQVKLPLECPLHPLRDVFGPRQDAKKRDRPTQWTCRLCGKSFYQEKYVDIHFQLRHKTLVNEAEDAVCLADYCDIMRCEVFQSEEASLNGGDTQIITDLEVWGDSLGQSSALAKANTAYLSLIPLRSSSIGVSRAAKVQNRHLCQEKNSQNKFKDINRDTIKDKSSNENSEKSKKLNDSTMKKNFATGTRGTAASRNDNDILVQSNQSADDNDQNSNSNKTQNGNLTNIQKVRANCRSDELSKLRSKCEYLVRTCIVGLLLQMTDNSFREMEDEMKKAVCWYLSCDRYWEDGPLEPRAFPWGLILILIMVLSLGICFCYYIIWILFDSEESTINANHMQGAGQHYQQQHHYQQQQQRYDYRHSPRRYMAQGPPPPPGAAAHQLHQQQQQQMLQMQQIQQQQDILDRRGDYTNRLVASSSTVGPGDGGGGVGSSSAITIVDCDSNTGKFYNAHHLDQHHHSSSASSLRPSLSSQDIIHNDLAHNEHYIYVTYPPDLKKRLFEKYD